MSTTHNNKKSFSFVLVLALLAICCFLAVTNRSVKGDDGGGAHCVGCVIVSRVLYQIMEKEEPSAEKALGRFCQLLPENIRGACDVFIKFEGPILVKMLENAETPDIICQQLKFCTNTKCHLYPYKSNSSPSDMTKKYNNYRVRQVQRGNKNEPWWKKLLEKLLEPFVNTFGNHVPLFDNDGDMFSTVKGFRGTGFRGKDCAESNPSIYPGRRSTLSNANVDENCNGIVGTDPASGKSYEELLCGNITQRGVAVLGDSASAHFRLPEQFVLANTIDAKTYSHLLGMLELEIDWPHLSSITGYMNDTTGLVSGSTNSIYLKMKERNRCIHRDFQNIGVNGARTGAMVDISKTLARDQQADQPLLLFYSLVGNDVCSGHADFDHFTSPANFYTNVVNALNHLDTVLPADSYVVFVGLADGGLLYDFLHEAYHPLGVKYPAVYDFLNCLETTPCWGWMNTNATIRNITTQHANELSKVYSKIIADKQGTYKNFKMLYQEFPLTYLYKKYIADGGNAVDLIEPMDGFHPSQIGNTLIAQGLYDWLNQNHPEALGPINPNNAQIEKLFGDQGGY